MELQKMFDKNSCLTQIINQDMKVRIVDVLQNNIFK